jgi:cyclic lactone autoinducer peptide
MITILAFAPIGHVNKPLSAEETVLLRKKASGYFLYKRLSFSWACFFIKGFLKEFLFRRIGVCYGKCFACCRSNLKEERNSQNENSKNPLLFKALTLCASFAFIIAASSNMVASNWIFHQPELPERVKMLKK